VKSRRDQVQAHAYVMGRLTSALVHGEPDAPESPTRRTTLGSFGGVMLSALAVAGCLIWGLISPAKSAVFTAGELVQVKETGSRYIFANHELHPVLNWSSAMLLLNGKAAITAVSEAALTGVRQGRPLGIVGAPDALPPASAINTGAWLVCAPQGGGRPVVSLTIGKPGAVSPAKANVAGLAQTPGGSRYLIFGGYRMKLDAPWIAGALGLARAPVIQASDAWLNAVPVAPDLRPIGVGGRGGPGPVLGGRSTRIGEVLVAQNVGSAGQFYLAAVGGITPISPTQAAMLLGDPATISVYRGATVAPVPVSTAAIATAHQVRLALPDGSPAPHSPPVAFSYGAKSPCMDYPAAGAMVPALVAAQPPAGAPPAIGQTAVSVGPTTANLISVTAGGGALVRPQAAPGVGGNSLFLVTEAGAKYPVPSATAATALGYRVADAARLPAALLDLLPTGPALNLPALAPPTPGR
jgi:type VII secretion protein EccB